MESSKRTQKYDEEPKAKRAKLVTEKIGFELIGGIPVFGWAPKPYDTEMKYGFFVDERKGTITPFDSTGKTSRGNRVVLGERIDFPYVIQVKNNKTNLKLAEKIKALFVDKEGHFSTLHNTAIVFEATLHVKGDGLAICIGPCSDAVDVDK